MQVQENYPLKNYNTFRVEVHAKYYSTFSTADELEKVLSIHPYEQSSMRVQGNKLFILGGGSNILFTKDYNGLVLKNEVKGIHTVHEDDAHIYIKAGAGENWHEFVMHCIRNNMAGVENLSLIPGNIGASPMQNIGAYGSEIKDVFHSLEAFHLRDKRMVSFSLNDCEFGYRESIFKKRFKDEFVIMNVTYRLNKRPVFNISYGAIKEELEKMNVGKLSIRAVSQAVINIRSSKLPDPAVIGNAGSFFKNPEVPLTEFQELQRKYQGVIGYPLNNGNVKLAAAWLIENCGPTKGVSWRGYRTGDVGCHDNHALVLVNYGNATGKEISDLSEKIKHSVNEKFNVRLHTEVNII